MRRCPMLALAALAPLLAACDPDPVSDAESEVRHLYNEAEIYGMSNQCWPKEIDGQWFLKCGPADDSLPGDLYTLGITGEGEADYVVRVVNGKASQHMGKLTGLDCPGDSGTRAIPARYREGTFEIGCESDLSIPIDDILKDW